MFRLVHLSALTTFLSVPWALAAQEIHAPLCLHGCPTGGPATNDIIVRDIYVLSSNDATKFADWVAYRVTKQTIGKSKQRTWKPDPLLDPTETLEPADYKGAHAALHTDRGHQAPLAALAGTPDWRETNYLSNITPQKSALNQGPWVKLEAAVRLLAQGPTVDAVYVMTGPLYEGNERTLPGADENHTIPSAYWKIVAVEQEANIWLSGFIMPQSAQRRADYCGFVVTVDEVERRSGLDMFHGLSLERQVALESGASGLAGSLGCDPPTPPTPISTPSSAALLLSCEDGVFEIDTHGARKRTISTEPAEDARRLNDGSTVVLASNGGFMRIDATGKSKKLAQLPIAFIHTETPEGSWQLSAIPSLSSNPRWTTGEDPYEDRRQSVGLTVQEDFWLNETSGHACLRLMDRNANMADVLVNYLVNLSTGALQWRYEDADAPSSGTRNWTPQNCDSNAERAAVLASIKAPHTRPPYPFEYSEKTGRFSSKSHPETPAVEIGTTDPEFKPATIDAISPTGRWKAVSFFASAGDYIYVAVLILDLKTGAIIELRPKEGGRDFDSTHRLSLEERERLGSITEAEYSNSPDAPGAVVTSESPRRFVADNVLQLGRTLIHLPNGPVITAPGEVAPLTAAPRVSPEPSANWARAPQSPN